MLQGKSSAEGRCPGLGSVVQLHDVHMVQDVKGERIRKELVLRKEGTGLEV